MEIKWPLIEGDVMAYLEKPKFWLKHGWNWKESSVRKSITKELHIVDRGLNGCNQQETVTNKRSNSEEQEEK